MGQELSYTETLVDGLVFLYDGECGQRILSGSCVYYDALFWEYGFVYEGVLMLVHAMRFDGFIVWNYWLVLTSFLVSWLTCQVICSLCLY